MADQKKRGLFERLFKPKRQDADEAPSETEAKPGTPAGSDGYSDSAGKSQPALDDVSDPDPSVLNFAPGRPHVYDPPSPEVTPTEADHFTDSDETSRRDRQDGGDDEASELPTPDRRMEQRGPRHKLAQRLRGKQKEDGSEAHGEARDIEDYWGEAEVQEALDEASLEAPETAANWREMFGEEEGAFPSLRRPTNEGPLFTEISEDSDDDENVRLSGDDDGDTVPPARHDVNFDVEDAPGGDRSAFDEPVLQEPAAEQPASEKPVAEKPVVAGPNGDRAPDEPAESEAAPRGSWFNRLKQGLSRTSTSIAGNISSIFTKGKLDDETLEELEDALIQADLGIDAAIQITEALAKGRYNKSITDGEVKSVLAQEIERILEPVAKPLALSGAHRPEVILMVGVNGSGKTTTIGKLSQKFVSEGKSVMLAAGDTFRAAAIEQLKIWGERTGSHVVARETGADAAGLAFDAMNEAKAAGSDILLVDTAGRLQNKAELMAELEKVVRVIKKHDPTAPHHVILTLDATTGQNAVNQADVFGKSVGVTGLVMTKLDGTARGGILVAIAQKHGLPVHFIGVGESAEDLQAFKAGDFARAIAGLN